MNKLPAYFKSWPTLLLSFVVLFSACKADKTTTEVNPTTLEGTWEFIGYQRINEALDKGNDDVQENPVVEFKQGSYGGSTPNNAFAGSYTLIENDGIVMSTPSSTLANETQWGARFLSNLPNASHFVMQNNQLQVYLKDTEGWMVFQPKK
ncbi:hypothetical protein BKI52_28320 [marine bacterium AO1-C]|nr:hypothetical protein BKI52_28320 [marine bacterium AO1-C]